MKSSNLLLKFFMKIIYFANISINFWFPRLSWMFYTKHLIVGPKWPDWLCFIVSIECYGRLCHKSRSCKCLLWGPWPFFGGLLVLLRGQRPKITRYWNSPTSLYAFWYPSHCCQIFEKLVYFRKKGFGFGLVQKTFLKP